MASVQMDQRAKLVGGIIATLVLILGLHWFVYQSNQHSFVQARDRYNKAKNDLANLKTGKQADLDPYTSVTARFEKSLARIRKGLEADYDAYMPLDYPPPPATPTPPTDPAKPWGDPEKAKMKEYEKYFAEITDKHSRATAELRRQLNVILDRRDRGKMKLDFLGPVFAPPLQADLQPKIGWYIPAKLPDPLESSPAKITDILNKLQDIQVTIAVLATDSVEKIAQKNAEYGFRLREIGINENAYSNLRYTYDMGEFVPLYNLMAQCELLLKKMPKDQNITREKLETLLFLVPNSGIKVAYPQTSRAMYTAIKQLRMLDDLLDRAEKNGITSVDKVRLIEYYVYGEGEVIKSDTLYSEAGGAAAPAPGATGATGAPTLFNRQPDISMYVDSCEYPKDKWVGVILPIEMWFTASYENAMKFVYHLAHCERGYETHALRFSIDETKRNPNISVSVTVLGYASINGLSKEIGGPSLEKTPEEKAARPAAPGAAPPAK